MLVDFMEQLDAPAPYTVLNDAESFVPTIDLFMRTQHIEEAQKNWITSVLGYFIGEWTVQKYSGCWFVNEIPDSRFFSRYVVGEFMCLSNKAVMIDPFSVATDYVDEVPPRDFRRILQEVSSEAEQCS